jgi:Xaa-Pro aminopeptidase
MTEVDEKIERVVRLAHARGLSGIVLSRQPNFAWLTAGQSNRIDGSVDSGAGSLLVTADGHRYVIANTIEMPRLHDEALRGLGFEPLEYAWVSDHAAPSTPLDIAASRVARGALGSDDIGAAAADVSRDVRQLQAPLTDAEVDRYRSLGRDVAHALEQLCGTLTPGMSERAVAARVTGGMAAIGARAIVTLVGADDRIARFRHPVPTLQVWTRTLLVGLCAERDGIVVALSRVIATKASSLLRDRTAAAAVVFGQLLAATRQGVTGAELYARAAQAYRDVGFDEEEARHHQGGAIGYRARDWIAHPQSRDVVQRRQAFAWNPSITGTKVEDTALLTDDRLELITATGDWPALDVSAGAVRVQAPGVLEIT